MEEDINVKFKPVCEINTNPVLHTNGTYSFTNKQKEYVTKNMAELLTEYEHANSPKGIDKI